MLMTGSGITFDLRRPSHCEAADAAASNQHRQPWPVLTAANNIQRPLPGRSACYSLIPAMRLIVSAAATLTPDAEGVSRHQSRGCVCRKQQQPVSTVERYHQPSPVGSTCRRHRINLKVHKTTLTTIRCSVS